MPVVEVMNYDKPVIASNLSIFQELIGDEINYFTISDDNKESANGLQSGCQTTNSRQRAAMRRS